MSKLKFPHLTESIKPAKPLREGVVSAGTGEPWTKNDLVNCLIGGMMRRTNTVGATHDSAPLINGLTVNIRMVLDTFSDIDLARAYNITNNCDPETGAPLGDNDPGFSIHGVVNPEHKPIPEYSPRRSPRNSRGV